MKLVAKRTITVLGKMTPLSREIVYGAFSEVRSFSEPNLYKAFEKYKLIPKK